MAVFNLVKRLPLDCLHWAFSFVCLVLNLSGNIVLGAFRLVHWLIKKLILETSVEPEHIIVLGASNSGKSAVLYRIKLGEFIQTIATSSFIEESCSLCSICLTPYESCEHSSLSHVDVIPITLCELGMNDDSDHADEKLKYCSKVLFVVDATDPSANGSSMNSIANIIGQHNFFHRSPKYAIFNNKTINLTSTLDFRVSNTNIITQDVIGSNESNLISQLNLPEHLKDRILWVNGSALTGSAIIDAMRFLLFEVTRSMRTEPKMDLNDLIQLY